MLNIMIDTETMGTGDFAPILSLGATVFNADGIVNDDLTGEPFEFYSTICLRTTTAMGAKIETDTLLWWLTQSDDARKSLVSKERRHVREVMQEFAAWWPKGNIQVWANSPTFDLKKLEFHLMRCKVKKPWDFRQERDFRTIQCSLPNIEWQERDPNQPLHNALVDARSQTDYLIRALRLNKMSHAL